MKKFWSIFIVMVLAINSTAFADAYDFLKTSYTSYEAEFEMSMDVDGKLDFLNALPGMEYARNFVDVEGLVKGLSESEYTGKVKFNANEEFTKMQASFEMFSKVPINVNRNLKVTTEAVYGMWIDCDLTDDDAPKLDYIYASPIMDKYLYIDMISLMKNGGNDADEFVSVIKSLTSKESIQEISDKMMEVIKNNSKASEKGSKVTITITDAQMKELILQVFDIAKEMAKNTYEEGSPERDDIEEAFSDFDISEYLDKMQIFADEALVMEFTKNADGTIKGADERINFNMNLNSIIEAIGGTMLAEDDSLIKYSLLESVNYSKINQKVNVEFPKLTEDNSIDLDGFINSQKYIEDYDWDGPNCRHQEYMYLSGDYIPMENNEPYCSFDDFVSDLGRYGYDFDVKRDGNLVTITEKNGLEKFSVAQINIDSPVVLVDGKEYLADNKAILSDGEICVDFKTLELIFDAVPRYATVYLDDNSFYASFIRKSPQCHHTQEEIDSWYDEKYDYEDEDSCEHFQEIYNKDDRPYKGKPYFALRDVAWGMFNYDRWDNEHEPYYSLSCDNGVITLVDLYGKEGFNTVIMTNGSNEINIDGNIFWAEAPVEIENGTTYIDFSAVNAIFGAEISSQELTYNSGYFDEKFGINVPSGFSYKAWLRRKLPTCPHEDVVYEY